MTAENRGTLKQIAAGMSASLSGFIVGCWVAWSSPAIKGILDGEADLKVTGEQISWIVALMDLGNILSPIPSGYLSDWLGRKNTLILTSFLFFGTWVLAVFGTAAWHLFIARVGAGIGKGVAFTVVPMYLGEIAGVHVRGAISTIFPGQVCLGVLFEYCVGPFVSYKVLNLISGVVPIVFFSTFLTMPESPYYYLMKRHNKEARRSLAWFRNTDVNDDVVLVELDGMHENVQKDMKNKGRYMDLIVTSGNRRALTIVMVLAAFQRIGGSPTMFAYTIITLPVSGGYFSADKYMIVFGLTLVVGNFTGSFLVDKLGRKPLLIFSCASCALFTGISAVFYWNSGPSNDLGTLNWIPYFCFVMFGVTYSLGIGFIPSTFVGELFPTNIKSVAASIVAICYAVGSFFTHKLYFFVKTNYGAHFMFTFFSLVNMFLVVFTIFVVLETKNKTFLEIQEELTKDKKRQLKNNEEENCLKY